MHILWLEFLPSFFWQGLYEDIKNHMQQCLLYQQAKMTNMLSVGLLQPLPFLPKFRKTWPWNLSLAYLPLMALELFWWLLIDYPNMLTLAHSKLITIESKLMEYSWSTFWNCLAFWNHLYLIEMKSSLAIFCNNCSNWSGTTIAMSSTYYPQSDRKLKALNRCLEMYLRCFTADNLREMSKLLP